MKKSNHRINNNAFWEGFFFLFGFSSNPFLKKARDIASKTVNDRMSENWANTSKTFNQVYTKEARLMNE